MRWFRGSTKSFWIAQMGKLTKRFVNTEKKSNKTFNNKIIFYRRSLRSEPHMRHAINWSSGAPATQPGRKCPLRPSVGPRHGTALDKISSRTFLLHEAFVLSLGICLFGNWEFCCLMEAFQYLEHRFNPISKGLARIFVDRQTFSIMQKYFLNLYLHLIR